MASLRIRPLEQSLLSTSTGRRLVSETQRSAVWAPIVTYLRALRPVVHPFAGRFRLIDATSLGSADVVGQVPEALKDSAVVITDDPDLAPLRRAGLLYEYVPRTIVESGGLAEDGRRTLHLQRVYNAAAPVRVESLS